MKFANLESFFYEHIEKLDNGCWLWRGPRNYATMQPIMGYREAGHNHAVNVRPWAYRNWIDDLAPDEVTWLDCPTVGCVNPSHMKKMGRREFFKELWLEKRMKKQNITARRKAQRRADKTEHAETPHLGIATKPDFEAVWKAHENGTVDQLPPGMKIARKSGEPTPTEIPTGEDYETDDREDTTSPTDDE